MEQNIDTLVYIFIVVLSDILLCRLSLLSVKKCILNSTAELVTAILLTESP
jgi:hypothetical protein